MLFCLGRKAGYLGSAYFIGNFAGSMAWGWLSDAWGRRPTLLLGCIGAMFSSLLFGFRYKHNLYCFVNVIVYNNW